MKATLLAAALLAPVSYLPAQKKHKSEAVTSEAERPSSDAHSFMELFNKLERDWGVAAQKKDHDSLDGIVASEFVERDATNPDHIVSRTEWMDQNLKDYKLDPSDIRSMTVRAFLGNAVVIFVQRQKPEPSDPKAGRDYLIVDVWVANRGKWQVVCRSVSPA